MVNLPIRLKSNLQCISIYLFSSLGAQIKDIGPAQVTQAHYLCHVRMKLCAQIKDNNNSPHGKFHRFLFPFTSKFPDLNFTPYVLYIYSCYMKPICDINGEPGLPVGPADTVMQATFLLNQCSP